LRAWAANLAPDGFTITFADGHTRRLPRLTRGPFRYRRYADRFLEGARRYAHVPVKQAVISPSALKLMYPAEPIADYSREQFIDDLLREHERGAALLQRAPQGAGGLHRRPPGDKSGSLRQSPEQLRRPEQPRAVALLSGRAPPHRRAYLPRQRPRIDA